MNARQRKFADAYLKNGNATQAAIAAGYSKKSAYVNGPRMLENAVVAEYIKSKQEKVAEKVEWHLEDSIRILAGIATYDHAEVIDEVSGQPKSIHQIPKETRLALDIIRDKERHSESQDGTNNNMFRETELKPCNRIEALKEINKLLGLYSPDKLDINFQNTVAGMMAKHLGRKYA